MSTINIVEIKPLHDKKIYFLLSFVQDSSDICVRIMSHNRVSGTAVVTRNQIITVEDKSFVSMNISRWKHRIHR
jgi:hypothetical protein